MRRLDNLTMLLTHHQVKVTETKNNTRPPSYSYTFTIYDKAYPLDNFDEAMAFVLGYLARVPETSVRGE